MRLFLEKVLPGPCLSGTHPTLVIKSSYRIQALFKLLPLPWEPSELLLGVEPQFPIVLYILNFPLHFFSIESFISNFTFKNF